MQPCRWRNRPRRGRADRVIVMTAASETVWRVSQYLDRIHKLVRKPFNVDLLADAILACCDQS